jgi:hypothetical protein
LALHYANRLSLVVTHGVDPVRTASDFRRMPDDLTLRQGLEVLLDGNEMTVSGQPTDSASAFKEKDSR